MVSGIIDKVQQGMTIENTVHREMMTTEDTGNTLKTVVGDMSIRYTEMISTETTGVVQEVMMTKMTGMVQEGTLTEDIDTVHEVLMWEDVN